MRRAYERSSTNPLLRPARFLLLSLFLMTLICCLGVTAAVFAQTTADVCRETQKVLDQYDKEWQQVDLTLDIINNEDKVRNYLSELRKAIANGYIMSALDSAAAYAGFEAPGSSPKERLAFQKTVRPALERELQKALSSNKDDLEQRKNRIEQQLESRKQKLWDLKCEEVLKRESSSSSNVSLESGEYDAYAAGYASVWTLTISGSSISGTSEWQCCPGHRIDKVSGSIEGDRVTITRECSDQGWNKPCKQVYTGTISGSSVSGSFTMDGKPFGPWSMTRKR